MAFQTSYGLKPAVALEGQQDGRKNECAAGIVTGSTIQSGVAVVWRAADSELQVRNPSTSAEITGPNLRGIVSYDPCPANVPHAIGDTVSIVKRGRIFVWCEEAVTPADQPFIRFASGTFSVLGRFRKTADGATAVGVANGAIKFLQTITTAGLILVEINLP